MKTEMMDMKGMAMAVLVSCLILCACGGERPQQGQKVMSVTTAIVGGSSVGDTHGYVGTVVERSATALSFEVAGKVSALHVDEGDRVRRGQVLATVAPTTLADAHSVAAATLRQAQDAYRRMQALHKSGVISDLKWVEVETKLDQAKAAERIAREELGRSRLVAPADGVIARRSVEIGTNVLPGQQIYRLVDVSKVDIKVAVPEKTIASIHKGMPARITVGALGDAAFTAGVTEIGVEANPLSHTYDVKLSLDNPGGRLRPGMVCSVSLGVPTVAGNVVIPMRAVELDTDNSRFVWVVIGGKAVKRPISLGGFTGDGVLVTKGLAVGDRLIVDGGQKVSQGMSVREAENEEQ